MKDLFTAIKDALLAIGVLVGGGWALWRFVLEREGKPKIQFDLDLNILGKQGNKFLVEVIAIVERNGNGASECQNVITLKWGAVIT